MTALIAYDIKPTKDITYAAIIQQLDWMFRHEPDMLANLANCVAVIQKNLHFFWLGFYFYRGYDLVLGPFQGGRACPRIPVSPIPQGPCGHAAALGTLISLQDGESFPGPRVSSAAAKSEMAVPLVVNGHTELLMHVEDSEDHAFDDMDEAGMDSIMRLIGRHYYR